MATYRGSLWRALPAYGSLVILALLALAGAAWSLRLGWDTRSDDLLRAMIMTAGGIAFLTLAIVFVRRVSSLILELGPEGIRFVEGSRTWDVLRQDILDCRDGRVVTRGGVIVLSDHFDSPLRTLEADLTRLFPSPPLEELVREERRAGLYRDYGSGKDWRGMTAAALLFSIAGLFLWPMAKINALSHPSMELQTLLNVLLVLVCVLLLSGVVALLQWPLRSLPGDLTVGRRFLIRRGVTTDVAAVESVQEVYRKFGSGPPLKVRLKDGTVLSVYDLSLERPLKELVGLAQPGRPEPEICADEAAEILGKPLWRSHLRLWLRGGKDLTLIRRHGVAKYLRAEVEKLAAKLKEKDAPRSYTT